MFLRKGECFCSNCFRRFDSDQAVFITQVELDDSRSAVALRLKKKCRGYAAELNGGPESMPDTAKVSSVGYRDGIVESVAVRVRISDRTGRQHNVTLAGDDTTRACPFCYENGKIQYIPSIMGYSDSYLITLIGMKDAGKTSYAEAVLSNKVQNDLNRILQKRVTAYRMKNHARSFATTPGQLQITSCFRIEDRRHPVTVFLGDVAGETFQMNGEQGSNDFRIKFFQMLKDNCDAILLLHDERDVVGMPQSDTDNHFLNLINPTLEKISNRYTPVLCLLTKSDRLKEYIVSKGGILANSSHSIIVTSASPLFKEPAPSMRTDLSLACHMACANDLMRELVEGAITITEETPCFVVSSGTKQGDIIHYNDSCNILLPVLYLIRQWL